MSAPQREQVLFALEVSKPLDRLAQERQLLRHARTAVADQEMQAQADALDDAEAAVEALGGEARGLLAGKQFQAAVFPNQFISRHLRSAMRAR